MSWLLLAVALLLTRRADQRGGRHRPVGRSRRFGSAEAASLATLVAGLVLGGRIGSVLALPAAFGMFAAVRRLTRASAPPVDRQAAAFLLDLLAAVLRSGAPTDQAIEAVSVSVREHGGDRLRSAVEPLTVVGRLLRASSRRERQGSLVCSLREQFHRRRRTWLPDRGARERLCAVQVATRLRARRIGLLRIQGDGTGKNPSESPPRLQAVMVRWGRSDCGQSGFSQLKLSVVPGEKQFISNGRATWLQSRRQRLPRV